MLTQKSKFKTYNKNIIKQTWRRHESKILSFLVNRKPGIRQRYHRFHDGTAGVKKVVSWVYLLGLNFCYYVLFAGSRRADRDSWYEEKKPPCAESESVLANRDRKSVSETVSFLMQYEVISFDIFDTLIFRPFSEPTDLFFFLGEKTGILDLRELRMQAEADARTQKYKEEKHYEITLSDIWSWLENEIGVTKEQGNADGAGIGNGVLLCQSIYASGVYTAAGTWEAARDHFGHVFIKSIFYRSCCKKTDMKDMRNYMFPVNMKRVRQMDRYMKL